MLTWSDHLKRKGDGERKKIKKISFKGRTLNFQKIRVKKQIFRSYEVFL